jgi:hypothetical protein
MINSNALLPEDGTTKSSELIAKQEEIILVQEQILEQLTTLNARFAEAFDTTQGVI